MSSDRGDTITEQKNAFEAKSQQTYPVSQYS